LFGIERGVATGVSERPGKFELADEGILFLDEVGDMPLETQAMILRVLQEKEVYRIGGHQPRPARVRIVAATNQPLERLIDEGRFRSDLYYRIAGCVLRLPPLRERPEDITNLAAFFLAREAAKLGKRLAGLSRGAVEALHECSWPGNVRQLESEMARITAMAAPGSLIARSDLSLAVLERSAAGRGRESLEQKVAHLEQQEIHNALVRHSGDVDRAAEELGISRATLYRKKRDRVDE
jgi:transcriptional regulator with PAS, ATPase and Fis domain